MLAELILASIPTILFYFWQSYGTLGRPKMKKYFKINPYLQLSLLSGSLCWGIHGVFSHQGERILLYSFGHLDLFNGRWFQLPPGCLKFNVDVKFTDGIWAFGGILTDGVLGYGVLLVNMMPWTLCAQNLWDREKASRRWWIEALI